MVYLELFVVPMIRVKSIAERFQESVPTVTVGTRMNNRGHLLKGIGMRLPFVRFRGDDRPLAPWEERLGCVVFLCFFPLVFGIYVLLVIAVILYVFAWAALTPILPLSWKLADKHFKLNPSFDPECPACQSRMTVGQVDERGESWHTDTGRVIFRPAQTADCTNCQKSFRRVSLGKVWSSWTTRDAEHSV